MANTSTISKRQFFLFFQILLVSVFILVLVLVVLQQANPLKTRLERDSGIYIYVSNTLLKGGLPYVSAMETKPPGIFFIDAFALWVGNGTRWGIWLVEFLFLFTAACVGYYMLYSQFGFGSALIGSAVWLLGLNLTLDGGNFTEEYSLVFGFISLLLWTLSANKPRTFWLDVGVGLCAGFSALLRPNNTGVQISIILAIVILNLINKNHRAIFTRLSVIGIAAALPLIASGLYFYSQGAFVEFIEGGFLYNFSYTGGNFDLWGAFLKGLGNLGFPIGIGLIGYFVSLGELRKQIANLKIIPIFLWLSVNGVLEVILSSLSGKGFQHYFICWLPAIASATAILIYSIFPSFCRLSGRYPSWTALTAALICSMLYTNVTSDYVDTAMYLWTRRGRVTEKADPVVDYVKAHTLRGDLVLVWGGQAGINYLSRRDAPTPYIFYPLFVSSKISDRWSYEYYRNIQQNRPILILDDSYVSQGNMIPLDEKDPKKWVAEHNNQDYPYLVEVLKFIQNNYSLKDIVNEVRIYRLNR